MLKILSYSFFLAITGWMLLAQMSIAEEGTNGNLVTVQWLRKNLTNADVVILDASPAQIYAMKHIPGAINYDIFTYGVQELPVTEIEKRYQSWGISEGKKVVMYDQGGTYMATRLFFSLEYYGFPSNNLYILDGGLSKWEEAGLPVTNEKTPSPTKGTYTIQNINRSAKVELSEFLTASGDSRSCVLLEALDPSWHFGNQQFFGRPGHIPNAIMMPSSDFFNADKTFKSVEEIKKMAAYFGITREHHVYSHCGGGIAASVPYFALKYMLDYPNTKLYTGSQLEWVSDERDLPLWTYDAPYLMRDASWLKAWGGKMMRMYGVSQVSVVDVRDPETFNAGHLPFSINIPVDQFKQNLNEPKKLAKLLGLSGVNASHEALVVSGAGLTKESALAFVILEKLGQKKVSIFMDSMEKSAQQGFSPIKDSIATGAKKGAGAFAPPPTTYPEHFRTGMIISDSKSTTGHYSKVFIASGKKQPLSSGGEKVIHVPYTTLLNADGTPKPAKDIWDILSKAGVPRYGELICFSEDAGEAAANYFILKLMGYPDVKVWLN